MFLSHSQMTQGRPLVLWTGASKTGDLSPSRIAGLYWRPLDHESQALPVDQEIHRSEQRSMESLLKRARVKIEAVLKL